MSETPALQSSYGVERGLAASFLLLHVALLVVIDLFVALGSILTGLIGLLAAQGGGLGDAAAVLGASLVVGLCAMLLLGMAALEGFTAVLALQGRSRGLFSVSLLSLATSLLLLPVGVLSCSIPGVVLPVGMLFASLLALAFAGQIPAEAPPKR